MQRLLLVGMVSTVLLVGCGIKLISEDPGGSGGSVDAGAPPAVDAGSPSVDAGMPPPDAESPDPVDAGMPPPDAESPDPVDAGSLEAGPMDAGVCVDTTVDVCPQCTAPTNCGCETEAAANVEAMAEAVVAAYHAKGHLCGSAKPVPAIPPPNKKYQPATNFLQTDFTYGDDANGWPCIGFAITTPIHCQYFYQFGSGYMGPAVGGPDPGPTGFEVSVRGDSDADGVVSTYTITGTIDPTTNEIVLTPLFTHAPLE